MSPTTRRSADVAQQLFDVWHQLRRRILDEFGADNISFPRAKALWALDDFGPVRASALSEHLECTAATVTEMVDGLVRDGLATRAPDPSDRRAVLIDITPAGREVANLSRAHKRRILGDVFATLTADETEQLKFLLDRLAASPALQGVHA